MLFRQRPANSFRHPQGIPPLEQIPSNRSPGHHTVQQPFRCSNLWRYNRFWSRRSLSSEIFFKENLPTEPISRVRRLNRSQSVGRMKPHQGKGETDKQIKLPAATLPNRF